MRVISGALRGRRLKPVPGLLTRPTLDRVKEALFNILGPLVGARVLDLYAGTGSLGIEALSRGAESAVFVENAREALRVLRDNVAALGLDARAVVLTNDVTRVKGALLKQGAFDVVFADPPYADVAAAATTIGDLAIAGLIEEDAVIVIEHASRDKVTEPRLEVTDTRKYGDTTLSFLRVAKG